MSSPTYTYAEKVQNLTNTDVEAKRLYNEGNHPTTEDGWMYYYKWLKYAIKLNGLAGCYCEMKQLAQPRKFKTSLSPLRESMIYTHSKVWANGTTLRIYAMEYTKPDEEFKEMVREGFKKWEELEIGITFEWVTNVDEADVRVAFQIGGGSWSYVGRDIRGIPKDQPTMNIGWYNGETVDTATHEMGHTLGFQHEHQNPNAGLEWNKEAVYAEFARAPNYWSHQQTYHNIIRKIDPSAVIGSEWDCNSIMHYPFNVGLIMSPPEYRTKPLMPEAGLSDIDKEVVRKLYPRLADEKPVELKAFQSEKIKLDPGKEVIFRICPEDSRLYSIQTFGASDVVAVLFEEAKQIASDDDGGMGRNALIKKDLIKDTVYRLSIRMYYQQQNGESCVLLS